MTNDASIDARHFSAGVYAKRSDEIAGARSLGNDEFYLVDIFEHFFGELSRLRRVLEARNARVSILSSAPESSETSAQRQIAASDANSSQVSNTSQPRADVISACLAGLLQHYATHISRQFGSFGAALFEEAQLVMAALADDLFIHEIEWSGRADWQRNPIEAQLFGSSNSGNVVFDRIDALLTKRDPATVELACINLYALRLNFQGRYRGMGQQKRLDDYRQRLFAFIANQPAQLNRSDYRPFADAYNSTSDLPDGARLPHVTRWLLAIALFLTAYLFISHLVWSYNIADVTKIINLTL